MSKKRYGLRDGLFPHANAVGAMGDTLQDGPTNFEWDRSITPRFYTDFCTPDALDNPHPRIAWLIEGPQTRPTFYKYVEEHRGEFDYILTYYRPLLEKYRVDRSLTPMVIPPASSLVDYSREKWLFYPRGGTNICVNDRRVHPKSKLVSMVGSAKRIAPGHSIRAECAEWVQAHGKADLFGPIAGGQHVRKIDVTAPYMYTIVVAAENIDFNICDHLLDPLLTGTVPIFWGCPSVSRFFDPAGIIQFETLADLMDILNYVVSEDDYRSRYRAIEFNFWEARKYCITEDWIFEQYPFLFD